MNIEEVREYCLLKYAVTEELPFDDNTLVFKVAGRMFCLANLSGECFINLKNKPEENIELREKYVEIMPGYHMNKKHWNSIMLNGKIPNKIIEELINESYELVVSKLPLKIKSKIYNNRGL